MMFRCIADTDACVLLRVSYLCVHVFVLIKPKQSLQCYFEVYKNHCTFNRGHVQNYDTKCKETL